MRLASQDAPNAAGYAMAVLLVSLAVMAVLMTVAMPVWKQTVQREREEELIFRGKQYARAIGLFQRKFANAHPPSIDVLVEQRFLRKKYRDPMAQDEKGEFQILYQGAQTAGGPPGATSEPQGAARTGRPLATGSGSGTTGSSVRPFAIAEQGAGGIAGASSLTGARGGIIGVVSKSKDKSIRLFNGRNRYNEWLFVYTPATQAPGAVPGTQRPGQVTPRGGPGGQSGMPPGSAPRPGSPPTSPSGLPISRPPA